MLSVNCDMNGWVPDREKKSLVNLTKTKSTLQLRNSEEEPTFLGTECRKPVQSRLHGQLSIAHRPFDKKPAKRYTTRISRVQIHRRTPGLDRYNRPQVIESYTYIL